MERFFKPLALMLIVLLGLAVLAGCGGDTITTAAPADTTTTVAPKGELTYAMSGLYKPFNFTKDGELVGFDVEIGQALAEKMGMTAKPVTNPWETIIEGLKAKKYDVIIGSMAITEKRLEQVNFTNPYYRSAHEMGFAREVADRAIMMDDGLIIEDAAPETLFTAPSHERTQRFLSQVL